MQAMTNFASSLDDDTTQESYFQNKSWSTTIAQPVRMQCLCWICDFVDRSIIKTAELSAPRG
jgi:hypothetical protein